MIRCIACRSHMIWPLYSAGSQPLMALNLPRTRIAAKNGPFYPMDFYICQCCGHVFNIHFEYAKIPYGEDSNLMYNSGAGWQQHMKDMAKILVSNSALGQTIIDIGAGNGGFLDLVKNRAKNKGVDVQCIAFEPGIESENCKKLELETYQNYFIPEDDIDRFEPDILVCRHVLEHMENPCDFVEEIAYSTNRNLLFFAEVPCISKALETNRITDFLYEHVSNFTQKSLRDMFEKAGWTTCVEILTYNDEVAVWLGSAQPKARYVSQIVRNFQDHTWDVVVNIRSGLEKRRKAGLKIAFFGGAGKGAAFLNAYNLTSDQVVDSDLNKVGRHVPGTGQKIEHSDVLVKNPVDTIVITTRWRAADIYEEIKRKNIKYRELLVLNGANLQEYKGED